VDIAYALVQALLVIIVINQEISMEA